MTKQKLGVTKTDLLRALSYSLLNNEDDYLYSYSYLAIRDLTLRIELPDLNHGKRFSVTETVYSSHKYDENVSSAECTKYFTDLNTVLLYMNKCIKNYEKYL